MRPPTILAIALVWCATLSAQTPTAEPERFAAVIAWFDTLGYPPTAGRRFVRVPTGSWYTLDDEREQAVFALGVLLHDDDRSFRVLSFDLELLDFERGKAAAGSEQVEFAERTASQIADELLRDDPHRIEEVALETPKLDRRSRRFVAARALLAQDANADAARLLATIDDAEVFQKSLAAELAHVTWWRIVLAFDDPRVPYATLRAQVADYRRNFPGSPHADDAAETHQVLSRMHDEAAAHTAPADLAALPEAARIAELVYRLRDQDGWQNGQPGYCSVFGYHDVTDSPAHRLCEEGLAAVPALVAAFDDDTFTRSVGYHRDFYFSHRVLRTGDAAQQILRRITGVRFADRAAAESFARELQTNGHDAALELAVRSHASSGAAARLLVRDPQRLLAAVRVALANTDDERSHRDLLAIVGGVDDDEAEPLLRAHLRTGAPYARLAAALALYARDRRQPAIEAMLELWHELSDRLPNDGTMATRDRQEAVGCTLVALGGRRAIAAFHARPEVLGPETLRALGDDPLECEVWHPGRHHAEPLRPSLRMPPADPGTIAKLLVSLLDDRTMLLGIDEQHGRRRCDYAASSLLALRPSLPPFDPEASLEERNLQLERIRAACRE